MKVAITIILLSALFFSCGKISGVGPDKNDQTKPDSTIKLSHDDSIHLASFIVKPQMVTTSVTGTTLNMSFDEDVDILFSAEGYAKISAVHLLEDFKKTALGGFEFTTVAQDGNTTLDWVDDNLNNVILKSIANVTVNGKNMVQTNIHRPFSFFKVYDSAQLAVAEQNLLLSQTTDSVTFSSYSYFTFKNYPVRGIATNVIYKKGN